MSRNLAMHRQTPLNTLDLNHTIRRYWILSQSQMRSTFGTARYKRYMHK